MDNNVIVENNFVKKSQEYKGNSNVMDKVDSGRAKYRWIKVY